MRKPHLDGLRFILFLIVFTVHYAPNPLRLGYLGYAMPVFFVMSGFLITNLLVSAERYDLATKLKVFYGRRILRIFPSYFLIIGALIAAGALTYPGYFLSYLANVKLFAISLDPQSPAFIDWLHGGWRRESWHLWTMSVEEQFYILYPLALYLTPARYRVRMLFAVVLASIASRFFFKAYLPQSFYGALLPVCAEFFAWGCLFACFEAGRKLERVPPAPTLYVSFFVVVILVAVEFSLEQEGFLQFRTTHYQTPISLALGFFIWALWTLGPANIVVRALSWRPLVYLGEMSFTLYLTHLLALDVFLAMKIQLPFSPTVNNAVGGLATCLVMSALIWHLYEKPMYSFRRYINFTRAASLKLS